MKILLTIPTYNAGDLWQSVIASIKRQTLQPDTVVVIDSSSSDDTYDEACKTGFECIKISQKDFNHGLTRMISVEKYSDYDIAIFMTQDAILSDENAFSELVSSFSDKGVSAAYGRQLTSDTSSLLEKSMRKFNYPDVSTVKSLSDKGVYGLNTPFCSNSFAAYRIDDMLEVGGFGEVDFGEDMLLVAKLLIAGKKSSYVSSAMVYHSHAYSLLSEFMRGVSIGRMHKRNEWLIDEFGNANKRGGKLLSSVSIFKRPLLILQALPKFIGYRIGKNL